MGTALDEIKDDTLFHTSGTITEAINIKTYVNADLVTHSGDASIHFTEASIDHANIQNIGVNTHVQIDSHISSTSNPHSVNKTQVGLANVDNTSDLDKPISTATQTALNLKQDALDTNVDEDSGNPNYIYVGEATAGSSTASALWKIKRLDFTSGLVTTYADGNTNFDNIYDNREALIYS